MKEKGANNQCSERKIQLFIFQSNLKSIEALEVLLKKMKRELCLSHHTYCSIWVSVNEAISNAIIHGNKFDQNKKVRLYIQFKEKDWVCFTIKDEGSGFDFKNVQVPNQIDYNAKAYGRGIFFMKRLADTTKFSDKGATVDLYFKINSASSLLDIKK